MYLAIDVGGTKTLLALFSESGELINKEKYLTPKTYAKFLSDLKKTLTKLKTAQPIKACCCALPGRIDREHGVGVRFANLAWESIPIRDDLGSLLQQAPVYVENDAKLAGLSEALSHGEYKKVLYLTISTGIGGSVIVNGILEKEFLDMEPGRMVLNYGGSLQKWESFASGHALKAKYGKQASEIEDPAIWQDYVKTLAPGISELVATLTPDVIIIGGGVGAHYEKFGEFLKQELKKYEDDMVQMPPIIKAKRPEEAVIYGCYDYIKQSI